MKSALVAVALAAFIGPACRAASPVPAPEGLLACRKLPAASDRVRCYDAQVDKMSAAAAPSPAVTRAAPTVSKVAATPAVAPQQAPAAAKFGQETLPSAARPQAAAGEDAVLLSSITALRPVGRATYTISLANGQVWRQEEASDISVFFRIGASVRIEKGTLGSYHMSTATTGAKNWVRVTRLQ